MIGLVSKMYFWIVAIDDSWFKYDSLEMQQTDWLSGQPVHPGRGLAADWHLAKRFEDQHHLAESFFWVHLKGKRVCVDWNSLKIQFAKVAISPSPVIGSMAPPLVETGSLPQVQWWASWVGTLRGFLKHFSTAAGQETKIPEKNFMDPRCTDTSYITPCSSGTGLDHHSHGPVDLTDPANSSTTTTISHKRDPNYPTNITTMMLHNASFGI